MARGIDGNQGEEMKRLAHTFKRDYGVAELKRIYGKNLMLGLWCSILVNLSIIGSYWGIEYFEPRTETETVAVRITKYEELVVPPSITGKNFGLSAYPVPTKHAGNPLSKRILHRVMPGPLEKKIRGNFAARGLGEIRGELPSAPGANKLDPSKLLADNADVSRDKAYDDYSAVGGGGNSDEKLRSGNLIPSKEGDVPSGNAHSGVGSNLHRIQGDEGDNGGGQGGDDDRFGGGSGDSFGYSMSWLRGGTRRRLSGNLPKYPPGVNVEAQISILAVVSPQGLIKSVQPAQKANTQLENAAMKEMRYWKFEPLRSSAPQIDQSCIVTFNFKLK
jgi:hypothetical protein